MRRENGFSQLKAVTGLLHARLAQLSCGTAKAMPLPVGLVVAGLRLSPGGFGAGAEFCCAPFGGGG